MWVCFIIALEVTDVVFVSIDQLFPSRPMGVLHCTVHQMVKMVPPRSGTTEFFIVFPISGAANCLVLEVERIKAPAESKAPRSSQGAVCRLNVTGRFHRFLPCQAIARKLRT